jgi:ankyrin repeat protein
MSLLTPLNVNCHASDGRKSTPLHLAAGYNRTRIVQLLLQHGADVHAKVFLFRYETASQGPKDKLCSIDILEEKGDHEKDRPIRFRIRLSSVRDL